MQDIDPMSLADKAMRQIREGAFLTVRAGDRLNTMTIGWAQIGICWSRPILMVAVRDSRHTFQLMESSKDFTVTFPWEKMSHELMICGSKSGADIDKFKVCKLGIRDSRDVKSPVIAVQGLHYECRIVYKTAMNPALLNKDLEKLYPAKDYHTLYFGEVLGCYETGPAA